MVRLGVRIDGAAAPETEEGGPPLLVALAQAAALGGADHAIVGPGPGAESLERRLRLLASAAELPVRVDLPLEEGLVARLAAHAPAGACFVGAGSDPIDALGAAVERLRGAGVAVAVAVDPDEEALLRANEVGAGAVRLSTARYAAARAEGPRLGEVLALRRAAATAHQLGLRVHAGGGLDARNVWRVATLPEVEEVQVGRSVLARALLLGFEEAVTRMRRAVLEARDAREGSGGA